MARSQPVITVQAEVVANIRSERIGGHTVADLNAPDTFLRRVADRIIRESFENRFRLIVADQPAGALPGADAMPVKTDASIRIVERDIPPDVRGWRAALREGRPELRGYVAPVGPGSGLTSMDLRPQELGPEARAAATWVARRLAYDGLLVTVAHAMDALGLARFDQPEPGAIDALARIGLPVDLLSGFRVTEGQRGIAGAVSGIAAMLKKSGSVEKCKRDLGRVRFSFARSCEGFRALADSGQEPIRAVRVQVTSASYWSGPGDGGCLDLLRQFADAAPTATVFASVDRKHLTGFNSQVAAWPEEVRGRFVVLPEDLSVAQWAQDNGKSGRDAAGDPVLLVPRYASRGEVGAVFVPGESVLTEGLAAAGMRIVRSALHFQGGNVLMARDLASGERTLLVGEAEVWRNTALGLTAAQAEAGLRDEFGADRIIVLPAASFHLDFEVSVRATTGGLVALVNDAPGAARLILECGVGALRDGGSLDAAKAGDVVAALRSGRTREALSILGPVLSKAAVQPGRFAESFAHRFSCGPGDHGPSNLYRVLVAADLLAAQTLAPGELPTDAPTRAYLETFQRQEADRRLVRRRLQDAGMRVVPVPSMAEPQRGVNALNGLHDSGRYLMPTYGGLLAPVDAAAKSAVQAGLGDDVRIVGLGCAETQRRSGAVRCAISVAAMPGT